MILTCENMRPDVWIAPIDALTPNHVVTKYLPLDLDKRIDIRGMVNPLVAHAMSKAQWTDWICDRPKALGIRPNVVIGAGERKVTWGPWERDGLIWVVVYGNQRLRYAHSRGFTHVPVALCETNTKADEWKRLHYVNP